MGKEERGPVVQDREPAVLIGDELPKAIERQFGKGANLRFVHPMKTYKEGRSNGLHVGFFAGIFGAMLHEVLQHDNPHGYAWYLLFVGAVGALAVYIAYFRDPSRVIDDVKRSIDVYKTDRGD